MKIDNKAPGAYLLLYVDQRPLYVRLEGLKLV